MRNFQNIEYNGPFQSRTESLIQRFRHAKKESTIKEVFKEICMTPRWVIYWQDKVEEDIIVCGYAVADLHCVTPQTVEDLIYLAKAFRSWFYIYGHKFWPVEGVQELDIFTDARAYGYSDKNAIISRKDTHDKWKKFMENMAELIDVDNGAFPLVKVNTNKLIHLIEQLEMTIEHWEELYKQDVWVDIVDIEYHPTCGTVGCHAGWIYHSLPEIRDIAHRFVLDRELNNYNYQATAAALALWLFDAEDNLIAEDTAREILSDIFTKYRAQLFHDNPYSEHIGYAFIWSDPCVFGSENNNFHPSKIVELWKKFLDLVQMRQQLPSV
jgi:hypothetical protein